VINDPRTASLCDIYQWLFSIGVAWIRSIVACGEDVFIDRTKAVVSDLHKGQWAQEEEDRPAILIGL